MSYAQPSTHANEGQFVSSGLTPVSEVTVTRSKHSNNNKGRIRPVSIELAEVMFTGRVPISTWTFAFSINNKLWISDLTTLYFGKRVGLNKKIYREKLFVPDNRLDLEIGITAYNSYGDVLSASEPLRAFLLNDQNTTSKLVRLDEDWTQILFKFNVKIIK